MSIESRTIAVVIPAFKAASTIEQVINRIPANVDWIIVVNDASPDNTDDVLKAISDPRIILLKHQNNIGVGGAMVTGYRKALELGSDFVAKIDADDQMDPQYLHLFVKIAILYGCDYVKANRFGHLNALPNMPKLRLIGSLVLSFLTKFASGYWNIFDPQNGYVMISRRMLKRLNLDKIDKDFFFENSMLVNLNIFRAKIGELYLPARYGNEISTMRISKILYSFPFKLFYGFLYRVYQKYIFRSLSPFAILFIFGVLFMSFGAIWGSIAWYRSLITGIPSPTGTVIIALLPLLFGWSAILHALVLDVYDSGQCILFDYQDEIFINRRDEQVETSCRDRSRNTFK